MKSLHIYLSLIVLCTTGAFAQNPSVKISKLENGISHLDGKPFTIKQYNFDLPVYEHHISPDGKITVQLRKLNLNNTQWANKGEIIHFDPETGERKWSKSFKYQARTFIQQEGIMFDQVLNKLSRINPENGQVLWKSKSVLYRMYPENNLFVGYMPGTSGYGLLHGFDIQTGSSRWQRKIPADYGWDQKDQLSDSIVLIEASGLHTLNLETGDGWDMIRETYSKKTDAKKVGLAVLGGVAVAALGGMYIPYDLADLYLGISSNVLYHGNHLYYASKNKITCQTLSGQRVWDQDLNSKMSSSSKLFIQDDVVYMINAGYAVKYHFRDKLGTPFVAGFDANTGQQFFLTPWEDRKNYIMDYMVQNDELFLLYKDKIEIHSFSPSGLKGKQTFKPEEKHKMLMFIPDNVYRKMDSSYVQLSLDTSHYYTLAEDLSILQFDNDLNLRTVISKDSVMRSYMETAGYNFLGNRNKTVVVDRQTDHVIAEFEAPVRSVRYGNKLYFRKENTLSEIDITRFLTEEQEKQ